MKIGIRTLCVGFLVSGALLLMGDAGVAGVALAQQKQGGKGGGAGGGPSSKEDKKYLAVFRDSVARAAKSTVRVQCDGKDTALGVVITADGFILTKANDLTGKITVKLATGEDLEAKWVGVQSAHDLAMLKIDAHNLLPIEWSDSNVAPVGNFVASVGTGPDPVAVGVVSVAARKMPAPKAPPKAPNAATGLLGVDKTADDPKGAKVTELAKGNFGKGGGPGGGKGGGGKGGGGVPPGIGKIKAGDIIIAIGDKEIKGTETLISELSKHKAGDEITLRLLRGEEELEYRITLSKAPPNRADQQNNMGSELSKRRDGFPVILQHDSVVKPADCGGPLVDLEGHVIGLNIARAGRVESHAVPSETIRPLLEDLMTGKMPPKK